MAATTQDPDRGPVLPASRARRFATLSLSAPLAASGTLLTVTLAALPVPPWVLAFQAGAPMQVVGMLGVAAISLVVRSRLIAVFALVLALSWTGYTSWAAGSSGGATNGRCAEPSLTIAAANVMMTNPRQAPRQREDLINALERIRADVLVTAETSPQLRADLAGGVWRHAARGGGERGTTTDIWVRRSTPVLAARTVPTGVSTLPAVKAGLGEEGSVWVVGVHLVAPSTRNQVGAWRGELATLPSSLARLEGPVVLAGDFNTSVHHREFGHLREHFADAARSSGRRWVRTWPADSWWGPIFDLDHVLVSRDMGLCAYGEGRIPGSDHRSVWAAVSVDPAR